MAKLALQVSAACLAVFTANLGVAPPVQASDFGVELNGTYRVLSNGEMAKRGAAPGGAEVFFDTETVDQIWTVTTSCVSPIECTGEVESDRGWTAAIRLAEYWTIEHEVPNWLACPDGSFAPGLQSFRVYGWDPLRGETTSEITNFLVGRDITKTASGACGRSQPLVVDMPVRMEKLA